MSANHCPTVRSPIIINQNSDFSTLGFPGSGLSPADAYLISGFTISSMASEDLIIIKNVDAHFNVTDNCLKQGGSGIVLENVTNGYIANNDIFENTGNGMDIRASSFTIISQNHIEDITDHGIFIKDSDFLNITDNLIIEMQGSGISLVGTSHLNNQWEFNCIYMGCNLNTLNTNFYANTINNTVKGLKLPVGSKLNIVSCNFFIENNIGNPQASDDGQANVIDSNFWTDHTGPDSNPIDGIVDIPYQLAGSVGNEDVTPYVSPNEASSNCIIRNNCLCAVTLTEIISTKTEVFENPFAPFGAVILTLLMFQLKGLRVGREK